MQEKLIELFIKANNGYGLFILRNNHFIYTNEELDHILGYNRNEIINLTPSDILKSNNATNFFNEILFTENIFQTPEISMKAQKKNKEIIEIIIKEIYKSNVSNSFIVYGLVNINSEKDIKDSNKLNSDIFIIRNIDGEIIYTNDSYNQLISNMNEDFINWYETDELVLKTGIIKYKKDLKFTDGSIKSYKVIKIPFMDYERDIKGIISIGNLIDSFHLKKIEEDTFIELDNINIIIDSKSAITVLNKDLRYKYVNDNFCNSINYTREELLGTTFNEANSGYHDKRFFENIYTIIKTGKVWRGDVLSIGKNGKLKKANVTIIPFLNSNQNSYNYVTIRNDYPSNELENPIYEKSIVDILEEQIVYMDKNNYLALFIAEIEEFNLLRMIHGEIVIKKIKNRLSDKIKYYSKRNIDLINLSDDTLGFFLNDINNLEQVKIIAQEISSLEDNSFENNELLLSFIVGVGIYSFSEENPVNLINNTYFALELAKKNNTKYQIYNKELVESIYKEYLFKNELFNALDKNQFCLYYQPRFNSKKIIIGAEALIRWKHPKLGLISPKDFIYLAEQTGLIIPIGEWVLRNACEQGKKLITQVNRPIKISLNVSPIQLLKDNFTSIVKKIIDDTKFNIDLLEIEITEDSIKANEKIIEAIESLRLLGISIAIDDFGTGYSSFELLKRINFDTLKIDRIFTLNIMEDKKSRDIIASLINLALDLNLSIIAEGVEYEEQFEILKNLNCNEFQGYLLSKPVPAYLFEKYLESQSSIDIEKRKYLRFNFTYSLEALLKISEINNTQIESGKIIVDVENISEGGLCFSTKTNFPNNNRYVLNLNIKNSSEEIVFTGVIQWSKKENDYYKYGLQFTLSSKRINDITKIFENYINNEYMLAD